MDGSFTGTPSTSTQSLLAGGAANTHIGHAAESPVPGDGDSGRPGESVDREIETKALAVPPASMMLTLVPVSAESWSRREPSTTISAHDLARAGGSAAGEDGEGQEKAGNCPDCLASHSRFRGFRRRKKPPG